MSATVKIIQIAVSSDPNEYGGDTVYALDREGSVWIGAINWVEGKIKPIKWHQINNPVDDTR
jgi:hypothetical protein